MALIFQDILLAIDSTGLYTLRAFVNGSWIDIQTISGALSGSIEVDAAINTIDVDTSILIPGQTYPFMWVDSDGVQSNIIILTIPEMGYSYGDDGDTGIGTGNLATLELLSVSNAGTGNNIAVAYNASGLFSSGALYIEDLSTATIVALDFNYGYNSGEWASLEFVQGHRYQMFFVDENGNYIYSNILYTSDPANYDTGYGAGIGAGNLSAIRLLGISNDGRGYPSIAYDGYITDSNNQLWLLHTRAGESAFYEGVSLNTISTGNVLVTDFDVNYLSYINGDQYQLCLIDTIANPSINLNDPSNILSNTLTAANMVLNSVSDAGGNIRLNMSIDPLLTGYLSFRRISSGGSIDGFVIGSLPLGSDPYSFNSVLDYVPGMQIQLAITADEYGGALISATTFTPVP
jgi:hypothetical protein